MRLLVYLSNCSIKFLSSCCIFGCESLAIKKIEFTVLDSSTKVAADGVPMNIKPCGLVFSGLHSETKVSQFEPGC